MSCNYCKRIRSSGVSTFMVRRGGGWVHLDHFLQEYDPCRMHMTGKHGLLYYNQCHLMDFDYS